MIVVVLIRHGRWRRASRWKCIVRVDLLPRTGRQPEQRGQPGQQNRGSAGAAGAVLPAAAGAAGAVPPAAAGASGAVPPAAAGAVEIFAFRSKSHHRRCPAFEK
jgi:hypothetical protein